MCAGPWVNTCRRMVGGSRAFFSYAVKGGLTRLLLATLVALKYNILCTHRSQGSGQVLAGTWFGLQTEQHDVLGRTMDVSRALPGEYVI